MSTKRILLITIFSLLLIVIAIGVMLLTSSMRRESTAIALPETPLIAERPGGTTHDALSRVEANRETIQDILSTLTRPQVYTRNVTVESFWEDGSAIFDIDVSVIYPLTSIQITPPIGPERRIIITPDAVYIWEQGDQSVHISVPGAVGAGQLPDDEWQMLLTFESVDMLDKNDIVDAGYIEFEGQLCFFVVHRSPLLGNLRTYYISLELGLVIAAWEYDESGELIYAMSASEALIGETLPGSFVLPDGTEVS